MPARKTAPGKLAVKSAERASAPPVSLVKEPRVAEKMDEIEKQERDAQNAIERVENDADMKLADHIDDEAAMIKGPPHRSSVLGYTLFSLGFDPQQDGEVVLDVRPTGISRILSGSRPTIIGMMRDIEPLVDALERPLERSPAPHPFLQLARHWLGEASTRFRAVVDAPIGFLVHEDTSVRAGILQELPEFADLLDDDDDGNLVPSDWPRDTGSLWGACCRIVGWSHVDSADMLGITLSKARSLADGRDIPSRHQWIVMFQTYDALLASDTSPVGIGIRWARAPLKPIDGDTREQIELDYSDAGDGPVLFVDRDAE